MTCVLHFNHLVLVVLAEQPCLQLEKGREGPFQEALEAKGKKKRDREEASDEGFIRVHANLDHEPNCFLKLPSKLASCCQKLTTLIAYCACSPKTKLCITHYTRLHHKTIVAPIAALAS